MPMTTGTNATTRTRTRGAGSRLGDPVLTRGDTLASVESGVSYRIDRFIGQGGYGQVYTARRVGRSRTVPQELCVKISRRIDAWIREAYFGQLLDGHPRAIATFDAFIVPRHDGRPLYCLAIEYAPHGDLSSYLARTGRRWKETTARREIAGILQVLSKLHRGQLLHRDLTPLNVFVCERARLKLGDFGIVRQQSDARGITVRTLNPLMAPSDIFAGVGSEVANARRCLPGWAAAGDVDQGRRRRAHPRAGGANAAVLGSPERDHLPMHR